MKNLETFIKTVQEGNIPECFPCELENKYGRSESLLFGYKARDSCTKVGMWAIITKQWTKKLAKWIGNRKCLEVMSGAGFLAKALKEHGVDIIATDDFSWAKDQHRDMKLVCEVENIEGKEAVEKYSNRDILIVSWPPYQGNHINLICDEWGNSKPIIYIGEGEWGCCANDDFFSNYKEGEDLQIDIPQWYGIHDYLSVGKWIGMKPVSEEEFQKTEAYKLLA